MFVLTSSYFDSSDPKPNRIPYEEWEPSSEDASLIEKKAVKMNHINDFKTSYGMSITRARVLLIY